MTKKEPEKIEEKYAKIYEPSSQPENVSNGIDSQKILDFLMNYGWEILVVIACIAALAFFEVLDPNNLVPDKSKNTTEPILISSSYCLEWEDQLTRQELNNNCFVIGLTNPESAVTCVYNINDTSKNLTLVIYNKETEQILQQSTHKCIQWISTTRVV